MQEQVMKKPKCTVCGSDYVYVRIDGTVYCRRCGAVTKSEEENN